MARLGVFVCYCGSNIGDRVDCRRVAEYAQGLRGVTIATDYKYMCSDPGQKIITDAIEEHDLTGVVVASCSPRMHEPTFRKNVSNAGLNPYLCEMANLREHCSWVHTDREEATLKAMDLVRLLVEKVKKNQPLNEIKVPVTKRALVIGGGIAGIQAALDIAEGGHEVLLVEKDPSIGGHMAQLDETFPTLDCSQCILTPKMVDAAQSSKIKLLTYSEVEACSGYIGNYTVKIRKKSTHVDWNKCNSCGECSKVCPVNVKNEFEAELCDRTAIYRPFPQAVPSKFTISKIGTAPCKSACPAGVNVQGYIALISKGKYAEALALEREGNPFPSVCGRVCTHPCESECGRGTFDSPVAIRSLKRFIADHELSIGREKPELPPRRKEKVAIVGSGPGGLTCAYFLAKQGYNVTVFEALEIPGGMLAVGIPDFRLPTKFLKADIDYIKDFGVEIKTNQVLGKDFNIDDLLKKGYKAAFLALGAYKEKRLGIEGEELEGLFYCLEFLKSVNLKKNITIGKNVAVIGGGNAAIDSARVALRIGAAEVTIVYRRSRAEMPADEEEIEAAEAEGVKIKYLTAPLKIFGADGKVDRMECIQMELGEPDSSGRRRPVPVEDSEFQIKVDTIIPAISQTPDLSCLPEDTKLNISSWGSLEVDPVTFQTNIPGVFAGGDVVNGAATVIEAIAQAKEAAISIDRFISGVDQKEGRKAEFQKVEAFSTPEVKKRRQKMAELPSKKRIKSFQEVELGLTEEQALEEAKRCLNCAICSECGECEKVCEAQAIDHAMRDEIIEEEVGAIVAATGYELIDPSVYEEYGYGKYPDIITGLEFERLVSASGPTNGELRRRSDGKIPKTIVFIQCVGSRDETKDRPYCSGFCCMYTAKHAMMYKHKYHDGKVFIFYMDVRAAGKNYEAFVRRAVKEDKAMYLRGRVSKIFEDNGKLVVRGADTLSGAQIEIKAEMVVLATAVKAAEGVEKLAQKLRIPYDEYNFLSEAHPKLKPVETNTAGIFLAGACQSPKDIPESVAQASAAASKVQGMLSSDMLTREPIIGMVNEETCAGCFDCELVCAYEAVERKEIRDKDGNLLKTVAYVNEGMCQGCGTCSSSCRSNSLEIQGFNDEQIYAEINAI